MKRLFLLLFSLAAAAPAWAAPLDPLFADPNLWTMKPDEFMGSASKLGFQWTSSAHDSARAAGPRMTSSDVQSSPGSAASSRDSAAKMTLFDFPAVESVARFEADKVKEISVVYYSRGEMGDLPKDKYTVLLYAIRDALTKAANVPAVTRGKDATSAVKADGYIWQTDKARYLLEYSFTKGFKPQEPAFRAEFIRLTVTPPTKTVGLLASATNTDRARFSGTMHIKRNPANGDVWLGDVPMVDQGQKGYCVVATAERVMRYYGSKVDENELAQVANTSESGTSSEGMLEALKKLGARLKVRVRELEHADAQQILKLITEYNRTAKHEHAAEVPDPGRMIDVAAVYRAMDVNVLRETRTKNKSDLNRFFREIQRRIDEGVPLLWTVMLGKVPETGIPQNAGGHMRLIIGYNTPKQEILFTDSWGAGHELKRMPAGDAWTMTTGVMLIEPL